MKFSIACRATSESFREAPKGRPEVEHLVLLRSQRGRIVALLLAQTRPLIFRPEIGGSIICRLHPEPDGFSFSVASSTAYARLIRDAMASAAPAAAAAVGDKY